MYIPRYSEKRQSYPNVELGGFPNVGYYEMDAT